MRIAYLITAYGEFGHLTRLVDALDCPDAGFFIHIDAKSEMPQGLLAGRANVVFVPRRKVWWGGWSHVEAILAMMREAAKGKYDYCVVLSGSDYPVRSNEVIFETLAEGCEFINAAPGFRPDKPESRVKYYRFDGFDRRRISFKMLFFRVMELALRLLSIHKRRYPFEEIYSGLVWSALSIDCVRYILDYIDTHPRYVSFFRTSQVPEEMFFQTIIGNSRFAERLKGCLVWMEWEGQSSPGLVTMEDLPKLAPGMKYGYREHVYERMFARKFNDGSSAILDEIDRRFRQ